MSFTSNMCLHEFVSTCDLANKRWKPTNAMHSKSRKKTFCAIVRRVWVHFVMKQIILWHFFFRFYCDWDNEIDTVYTVFILRLSKTMNIYNSVCLTRSWKIKYKITYIANGKSILHFNVYRQFVMNKQKKEKKTKGERQQLGSWQTNNMIFFFRGNDYLLFLFYVFVCLACEQMRIDQ